MREFRTAGEKFYECGALPIEAPLALGLTAIGGGPPSPVTTQPPPSLRPPIRGVAPNDTRRRAFGQADTIPGKSFAKRDLSSRLERLAAVSSRTLAIDLADEAPPFGVPVFNDGFAAASSYSEIFGSACSIRRSALDLTERFFRHGSGILGFRHVRRPYRRTARRILGA